jgi:cysteine sulfinate desulfinase/cysteine desulfurase-like protein
VLKAIGVDDDTAVLRFSLSRETRAADIDAAVEALRAAVAEIGAGAGRSRASAAK